MLVSLLPGCPAPETKPAWPWWVSSSSHRFYTHTGLADAPSLPQPGGKWRVLGGGKVGGGGFFSQKRPGHPAHQEAEINSTEEGLNNASWINDSQAINPYTLQPQGCVTHKITTSPSLLFLWCVFSKRRKPSQQGGWQRNKSRLDEGRREQRSKAREKGQKVEEMEGRWEISGRTKALASSAKH